MIAIALVVPMTIIGLVIGCVAVSIHSDEQERLLSEKSHLKGKLRDWYEHRGAGRPPFARFGQSAHREPYPHLQIAGLYRFR
jgi:hypothetical protein